MNVADCGISPPLLAIEIEPVAGTVIPALTVSVADPVALPEVPRVIVEPNVPSGEVSVKTTGEAGALELNQPKVTVRFPGEWV